MHEQNFTPGLSNHQLQPALIPDPEGNLADWERFAHTINGYAVMGDFAACADLANSGTASTLTELRCSLFFEARRDRHSGGFGLDEQLIRRLLREIKAKVLSGDLD